jgi:hypothetical protein
MSKMELNMRILGTSTFDICDIFSEDRRKRGEYVPPIMIQTVGDNGEVGPTVTLESSGKSTYHRGGTYGVVPGAPPEFNAANQQHLRQYGIGRKRG